VASISVPALARIEVGLGTLAMQNAPTKSLLHALEFEMLSSMGVNKHVKVEWRTIAREFRGIGLYSLSVEQFICWLEMILQHYQAGHTVSSKLRATLKDWSSDAEAMRWTKTSAHKVSWPQMRG
jgi:hypothetical protein